MADPEDPLDIPDNVVQLPGTEPTPPLARYCLSNVPTLAEMLTREIPRGKLITTAGEGGVGKSYLALDIAISLALGVGEFHRNVTRPPRRVIYVDSENGETIMQARYHALLRARDLDPEDPKILGNRLIVIDGQAEAIDLANRDHIERLGREILKFKADLVILDSFMAMTPTVDVTSNTEVRKLLDTRVRPLTRTGAAIDGLHHIRKLTGKGVLDSKGQGVMGARAWIDAVDEAFVVRATTPTKLSVEHVKGRTAGTHPTFMLGLDLPPLGTPVKDRRSTIKDLGTPQDTLHKIEAAKVHIVALLEKKSPREIGELDKEAAKLTGCSENTAKSARQALMSMNVILPTEPDNRKSPVMLVVYD